MTRKGASSTSRAVELKEFAIGNPSTQLTKQSVQYCEDSCAYESCKDISEKQQKMR